jgi:hypothetical protein
MPSSSDGGAMPSSSFSGTARPPRSRTPPPRAVAVPLDAEVLNPDTDFSLDLVKVQFKCTYATNFGQELRVVGGSPELGNWDVAQVRGSGTAVENNGGNRKGGEGSRAGSACWCLVCVLLLCACVYSAAPPCATLPSLVHLSFSLTSHIGVRAFHSPTLPVRSPPPDPPPPRAPPTGPPP